MFKFIALQIAAKNKHSSCVLAASLIDIVTWLTATKRDVIASILMTLNLFK